MLTIIASTLKASHISLLCQSFNHKYVYFIHMWVRLYFFFDECIAFKLHTICWPETENFLCQGRCSSGEESLLGGLSKTGRIGTGGGDWNGDSQPAKPLWIQMGTGSSLDTSCWQGMMWVKGRRESGVYGLKLSRRYWWRSIRLTAILNTSGIYFLSRQGRQVARRKMD